MADKLTIEQMRQMILRLEEAKALDEGIPHSYLDRLERATQLMNEVKNLPAIRWDEIATIDDIDKAEQTIHRKLELKNEIEKHLHTCALTLRTKVRGRPERKRQQRRSKEQMEYDRKVEAVIKAKRKELNIPFGRGVRLSDQDRKRLEDGVEKELRKQKVLAPKG